METFLGRYKNLIVLAAILFAQIVGLAVQVKLPAQEGQTRLIRLWAAAAITPFEKAVVHTQDWMRNVWTGYLYLHGVRRENRDLRAQIERMKLDEVRLSEDAKMARRIQSLLQFKEQYLDTTVAAQVIGTSGSDQSRVIYIDKGSSDGIKADMAVITPTGIVGKIVQVFPDSSQVLPINDQLSGVGALLKATRLQGILKGASNGATTLQYVMSDEKVDVGEEVVTSGGDRIFPKGLPVGRVVSVEPGKDLFLNIRVLPAARLDHLEEVLVVTKILAKPPDTRDLGPIRAADILADRLPTVKPPEATATPGAAGAAQTGAKPNAATTTQVTGTAGAQPRTGTPGANGVTRLTTVPGINPATRPAGTAAKPVNGTGTATTPRSATTSGSAANGTAKTTRPAPSTSASPSGGNGPATAGSPSGSNGNVGGTTASPKQSPVVPQQTAPAETPAPSPTPTPTPKTTQPDSQPGTPPGSDSPQR